MARHIRDSVVVITGASSGIGRATALLFAEQGAKLLLAARNEEALSDVCEACRNLGGEATPCPCDVTREEEVQRLAQRAMDEFGRINVWVNNAAITLFGRFEETPAEDWRRVLETNLFGYVHGARAAIPLFQKQGSGVLINVSSVVGKAAVPYASAYTTSKFAIRGFAESLRMELRESNIRVCTVYPASTDTPLFQHAGNYYGKSPKPPPPVYRPEVVAAAILACARRPRPEISIGMVGQSMMTVPHALSKHLYDPMTKMMVEREHFEDRPAPTSRGNLYEPDRKWTSVSGNWTSGDQRGLQPGAAIGAAIALLIPAVFVGYLITSSLMGSNPRKRTMFERVSRRMQPPARAQRVARSFGRRAGERTQDLREHASERLGGIGAALLASGLATHLRKGQLRSAAEDLRRYGRNLSEGAYNQYDRAGGRLEALQSRGGDLYSRVQERGSDLGRRAGAIGAGIAASRAGRAVRGVPASARREVQRRVCPPTPMQRFRRAIGI